MPTTTYTPLANITLGSSASSVTFSNIPNTYRDLILVVSARSSDSLYYNGEMRFNNDGGSNYSQVQMLGNGSQAESYSGTGTGISFTNAPNNSSNGLTIFNIMDYSATDKHKTVLNRDNVVAESTRARASRWSNTAAISSITLLGNVGIGTTYVSGSTFALYGVIA